MNKKASRLKRARRFRARSKKQDLPILTIHRTPKHITAQVIKREGVQNSVVACASTMMKGLDGMTGDKSNKANVIGKIIAEKARAAGVEEIAFDRSGFKYHGRVKSLADGAREAGLKF